MSAWLTIKMARGRIVKAKQKDWRGRGKLTLVGFLRGFGALALDGLRDVGGGVPGDVGLAGYSG